MGPSSGIRIPSGALQARVMAMRVSAEIERASLDWFTSASIWCRSLLDVALSHQQGRTCCSSSDCALWLRQGVEHVAAVYTMLQAQMGDLILQLRKHPFARPSHSKLDLNSPAGITPPRAVEPVQAHPEL